MQTVLTIGTFDVPHAGHASFLSQAKRLGDRLIVGVLDDQFVLLDKGKKPWYNTYERRGLVESMGYADEVYIERGTEDLTHPRAVVAHAPCIVAVGSDWYLRGYLPRLGLEPHHLQALGITLAFIPYTDGISTTEIERRLNGHSPT